MKKKSRCAPVFRSFTSVRRARALPSAVVAFTVVLTPSLSPGSASADVNAGPANVPSVGSSSSSFAVVEASLPFDVTLYVTVPGVTGFVAESMMRVTFFGSSWTSPLTSPPKPPLLSSPPLLEVPGFEGSCACSGSSNPERELPQPIATRSPVTIPSERRRESCMRSSGAQRNHGRA